MVKTCKTSHVNEMDRIIKTEKNGKNQQNIIKGKTSKTGITCI